MITPNDIYHMYQPFEKVFAIASAELYPKRADTLLTLAISNPQTPEQIEGVKGPYDAKVQPT